MRFFLIILVFISSEAVAKTVDLSIDADACKYLISHEAVKDGDAEYKAGIDVDNNPVIEADITPSVIIAPKEYSFVITVDLAKYMGLNIPKGLIGEARIGEITLKNGEMKFNGNPVEGEAAATLKEMCNNNSK